MRKRSDDSTRSAQRVGHPPSCSRGAQETARRVPKAVSNLIGVAVIARGEPSRSCLRSERFCAPELLSLWYHSLPIINNRYLHARIPSVPNDEIRSSIENENPGHPPGMMVPSKAVRIYLSVRTGCRVLFSMTSSDLLRTHVAVSR